MNCLQQSDAGLRASRGADVNETAARCGARRANDASGEETALIG